MQARTVTVVTRNFPPSQPRAGQNELELALERAGWAALREWDDPDLDRSGVVLLRGNPIWFGRQLRRLAALRRAGSGQRVVLWHTEPLPLPRDAGFPRERLWWRELRQIATRDEGRTDPWSNARELRRLEREGLVDALAVSTRSGRTWLAEHGVAAEHLPQPSPADDGRVLGVERDLDVLFVGELVPRRRRLLRELERTGVRVLARGGWGADGLWGEERTRLVNRARILLNLPRRPGHLSGRRLQLGMVNGALVVSEPIHDPAPYVDGEHFVSAPLRELPALIRHHLEREDERARIAEAGRAFVAEHLTVEPVVRRLAALLERAAADAPRRAA